VLYWTGCIILGLALALVAIVWMTAGVGFPSYLVFWLGGPAVMIRLVARACRCVLDGP
jgi:hypothetical protein